MPKNRQVVIAICAISWSLFLLPILTHLVWSFADSGPHPLVRHELAWMYSVSGTLHLPPVLLPMLTVFAYVGVFGVAFSSTVELVLSKWGIAKDERTVMPRSRRIVIGVCVISWSLLLLQMLTIAYLRFIDSGLTRGSARNWLPWPASLLKDVQPALTGTAVLLLFVLACASTAELVIDRWGVAKGGDDFNGN